MIDKKSILIEKEEKISTIFEHISCKKKFILGKDCVCSINFLQDSWRQPVSFLMLFDNNKISAKQLSILIKAHQSRKEHIIGDNIKAVIENVVIGPSTDGLVPEDYVAVPIGVWMDSKYFIGLVLNENVREFLNIVYSDLKLKISKCDFENEEKRENA